MDRGVQGQVRGQLLSDWVLGGGRLTGRGLKTTEESPRHLVRSRQELWAWCVHGPRV